MVIAALLFALAAVLGVLLAVRTVKGQERPLGVVLPHGAFAGAGLVALVVIVLGGSPALAGWALAVLVVAALGGFVLFGMDRTGRRLPVPLVFVHGGIAVVGFLLLVAALAGGD